MSVIYRPRFYKTKGFIMSVDRATVSRNSRILTRLYTLCFSQQKNDQFCHNKRDFFRALGVGDLALFSGEGWAGQGR